MMVLLSGHSLTAKNKFQPERMQLQLAERTSTATLTLDDSAPTISVGEWMQCEEGPAKGIVWRVKSIDTQFDTQTRTVQLEHAIATLKDLIIFGEVKPDAISGAEGVNPLASQAARFVLAHQSDWVLGTVERDRTNPYGFNGDTLYAALETVSSSLTECVWEYDFSKYPFRIHLKAINNSVVSEMRTDRNIKTLRKTVDRSRMYTRHYPIGKEDLHITGDYVSRNEGTYGVICKTETDQSLDTEEALRLWATERLNRHCEPIVTVTISGLDLSEATGEPLDSFQIGRVCRVPLPEYDTSISERVAKLNYPDVINEPMNVTVTLANELPDVASIIRQDQKTAASGGRAGAKKAKDDHAWFVDTEDHVAMVAEAVGGTDENGNVDWSRVSEICVDGEGIHQRVTTVRDDVEKHTTELEMHEDFIGATVEAIGANGEITAASICLAINGKNSEAKINADHIFLGKTALSAVLTVLKNAVGITQPLVCSSDLSINSKGTLNCYTIKLQGSEPITLKSTELQKAVKKAEIEENTNKLKLTLFNGDELTFSKATSISQSWSSGNKCVKATASGASDSYFSVDYRFNASSGQYYMELFGGLDGASNPLSNTSRIIQLGLNGNTVEIQNGSGVKYSNTPTYTITAPEWSHGNIQEQNGQPSGAWATFTLDTRYTYHYVYVTVGGTSKMILLRT